MSLPQGQEPTDFASGAAVPAVVLDEPQQLVGQTILGRFRVDSVLGVGGMAAVLRCHHLGLQHDVAVKVLHPEMSASAEISARFAREAQTMSRMTHPNCARVLDFGEFDVGGVAMQYLAMELLEGCELSELMVRPLPAERAMELMDQVLAGLEHAHAEGVVHRDLKPENVFVTTDHQGAELLKIVDFGIAKILFGHGSTDNMTVAGTIFGTPSYMSPEQCAGGAIDERTDVYAAGIILYEMLVGMVPFSDPEDPTRVIHRHIFEPVPELPPTVPAPLARLVMDMLAKEKAHRIPNMEAARARIAKIQRDLATGAAMSVASATLLPTTQAAALMGAPVVSPVLVPGQRGAASWSAVQRFVAGLPARTRWGAGVGAGAMVFGLVMWGLAGPSEPGADVPANVGGAEPKGPAALPALEGNVDNQPANASPDKSAVSPVAPISDLLSAAVGGPRATSAQLASLDAMIVDKAFEGARDTIRRLLDEYPKDARLHLRKARVQRASDASKALATYAQALELDRSLLREEATREEILALMRRPELEEAAIDLAIRQLGGHGLGFLIERVNDGARPIAYADRQRVIRAIEEADRDDEINRELNTALDLWQAPDSADPCATYEAALGEIEREPIAYYLGSTMRTTAPRGCALSARRTEVAEALQAKFAIAESDWVVPAAYEGKRSRRGKKREGSSGGGGGLLRRIGLR